MAPRLTRALEHRNYRLFFAGQGIGLVSLVPGIAGVYGACDVFITAGVGGAKMQFHMAVLSSMGGGQQKSRRAAASAKRAPGSHRMLNQW